MEASSARIVGSPSACDVALRFPISRIFPCSQSASNGFEGSDRGVAINLGRARR